MNRLILDADGVFLSERPYWNAALATACHLHGLRFEPAAWDALADAALDRLHLQRITKSRGCNSNYDFAAVLTRGLAESSLRSKFSSAVKARRYDEAATMLGASASALYQPPRQPAAVRDPLMAFGIARHEPFFEQIVQTFAVVNRDVATTRWAYPRVLLKESPDATGAALASARAKGFDLWVCTSRDREDIVDKIQRLALSPWLAPSRAITATDALHAQSVTGMAPLGKPHWFPVAASVIGYDNAVAMVRGQAHANPQGRAVYAGDAPADFLAVSACNHQGVSLDYIHVRSGVTGPEEEAAFAAAPLTLGVVDDLAGVVALLNGAA